MAFGDGNLIGTTTTALKLYAGFTTTESSSISSPGTDDGGISNDATPDLYSSSADTDTQYRHSGFTTSIDASYSVSAIDVIPKGISWGGSMYWAGDTNDSLYKQAGFSSTADGNFATAARPRGCLWDGSNVYTTYLVGEQLIKYSGFSSSIDSTVTLTGPTLTHDLSWDGTDYYAQTDDSGTETKKLTGFSSTEDSTISIAALEGIEWDAYSSRVVEATNVGYRNLLLLGVG